MTRSKVKGGLHAVEEPPEVTHVHTEIPKQRSKESLGKAVAHEPTLHTEVSGLKFRGTKKKQRIHMEDYIEEEAKGSPPMFSNAMKKKK
jgi:hypothetical protein